MAPKIAANLLSKLGEVFTDLTHSIPDKAKLGLQDIYTKTKVGENAVRGLKALEKGRLIKAQSKTLEVVEKKLAPKLAAATRKKVGAFTMSDEIFSHLKIAKGSKILGMATNSIIELSKAVNYDYQHGSFSKTPEALLKETYGWIGASVSATATAFLTHNAWATEAAGLGGYAFGTHVGAHAVEDNKSYYQAAFNLNNNTSKTKTLVTQALWGATGLAAPIAAPYLYSRLNEAGWLN